MDDLGRTTTRGVAPPTGDPEVLDELAAHVAGLEAERRQRADSKRVTASHYRDERTERHAALFEAEAADYDAQAERYAGWGHALARLRAGALSDEDIAWVGAAADAPMAENRLREALKNAASRTAGTE